MSTERKHLRIPKRPHLLPNLNKSWSQYFSQNYIGQVGNKDMWGQILGQITEKACEHTRSDFFCAILMKLCLDIYANEFSDN